MARIHVLGGTGYAGGHLVRTAAARGHHVVSFSRKPPAADNTDTVDTGDITYRFGDVLDDAFLASAFDGADVVISALSARGPLADGGLRVLLRNAADLAADRQVRFGVIGGAGSLLTEPGGPRYVDTPEFLDIARPESLELADVLDDLRISEDERLNWFLVSPAGEFGAHAPGEATGHYRIGGDVLLRDDHGDSAISGADLALAVIDEIENPTHHRQRFTVAY